MRSFNMHFKRGKKIENDHEQIRECQKAAVLAANGDWIDPAECLKLEQAEFDRIAEETRITESRAYRKRKGLDFDERKAAYQAKRSARKKKNE